MTTDEIVASLRVRAAVHRSNQRNATAADEDAAATLIESQASEIAILKTQPAYAEDAATKGDLARQTAGGMEMEIEELRNALGGLLEGCVIKGGEVITIPFLNERTF